MRFPLLSFVRLILMIVFTCLRRRLKELRDPAYTIEESERAVGLGRDNGKDRINAEINAKVGDKAGESVQDAEMSNAA